MSFFLLFDFGFRIFVGLLLCMAAFYVLYYLGVHPAIAIAVGSVVGYYGVR